MPKAYRIFDAMLALPQLKRAPDDHQIVQEAINQYFEILEK
jgi:hypothetical protein